ncbi:MAG TPA: ATP-dependent DNA helicase RecG [Chthoniobacteraceae bacterium]|nr:ATP-dependent DNA helicase RecG [Chthoniobacteraceae bacterium]
MPEATQPPASALSLATPLGELGWLPPPRVRAMERLGLLRVEDLLLHFPRRHEDRRRFDAFPREAGTEAVCVCGRVIGVSTRRFGPRKMVEVTLEEEGGHALSSRIVCRWFNLHYITKWIATGNRIVVYGKPKRSGKRILIDHPEFEVLEEEDAQSQSVHLQRIVPIHPATEGLTPRLLRSWIDRLLSELAPSAPLPHPLPPQLAGIPYFEALRTYHFPENWEALHSARRELVLAEFFEIQLSIAQRRAHHQAQPGAAHCGRGDLLAAFLKQLPFPLTQAQQRALNDIRFDLRSTRPMNRLLHGDVGSGKTVVALGAMLLAAEAGFQTALMAPTQILAEQHYLNFRRWLEPLGVSLALRTGSRKSESALPLFEGAGGHGERPRIVVGTHALLYEGAGLERPGLVVIDEQHKFGVLQRSALMQGEVTPDLLVMTATPIPRSLTMTLYGDLDLSVLDERPAHRGEIVTAARRADKLPDAIAFIRKHLERGRQAFIVYPLIDASERLEAKAAVDEFAKWEAAFAPFRCELLHGRLGAEEKEAVMERFRTNQSQLLVATTVIEVGIDVPNANIMLIENAERFGLAQLHQLRGRIGRGTHRSYCILIHAAETPEAEEKMATLEATSDGFLIAEADLRLRGPGDLLGTSQSGRLPTRLGNLFADADLMALARNAATALFVADPELKKPENRPFRDLLSRRKAWLGGG